MTRATQLTGYLFAICCLIKTVVKALSLSLSMIPEAGSVDKQDDNQSYIHLYNIDRCFYDPFDCDVLYCVVFRPRSRH